MSPAQRKGRLAELLVEQRLVEMGWDVDRPTGVPPYDMIARSPLTGCPLLVQVKAANDKGRVKLRREGPGRPKAFSKPYADHDFDLLAIVKDNKVYWTYQWLGKASVNIKDCVDQP